MPPTSVKWSENGETLAVGTFEGDLQVSFFELLCVHYFLRISLFILQSFLFNIFYCDTFLQLHQLHQLWDVETQTMTSERKNGHEGRIGCLAWNDNLICSGGRDK